MKRTAKLLVCLGLALAYSQAQATTYYITQSNTTPPFTEPADYLKVDVTANGSAWNFSVTLGSALSSYSTAEIDQFAFNTGSAGGVSVSFSNLPTGWAGTYSADSLSMDGFGKFDATVSRNGQTNLQTLNFTISPNTPFNFDSIGTCGQGCTWFSAHVKEISTGYFVNGKEVTSAYFGSSSDPTVPPSHVPVPAAAWLLGSGLIGLVGLARRKVSQ